MTRKDYVMLAAALNAAGPSKDTSDGFARGHASAVLYVADALAQDNPRFDRERFLKAAGVTE